MKRYATPYDILDLEQGSEAWKQKRFDVVTASQVAATVNLCPYQDRQDLLQEKLTRTEREPTAFQKNLFAQAHKAEGVAREWCRQNLKLEFSPAVLESRKCPDLIASLDGFNPEEKIIFEAKHAGEKYVAEILSGGPIKNNHMIQMQTQLYVSGAKKCVYFVLGHEGGAAYQTVHPDKFYHTMIPLIVAKFMDELRRAKSGEAQ